MSLRHPWERDSSTGYGTLRTTSHHDGAILRVGIHNPPMNLFDHKLNRDLIGFLRTLEKAGPPVDKPGSPPKIVIFHSEIPEFFIWWYDVRLFVPGQSGFTEEENNTLFTDHLAVPGMLKDLHQIFIAEVNGRASGSGNEIMLACDMSFGGPNAMLANPEAALGGMAVNGGAAYLVRALGIQRASEYLLGCLPIRATEAAKLGWINRAFPTDTALMAYVNSLAERIALVNAAPLSITKKALRAHGPDKKEMDDQMALLQAIIPSQMDNFRKDVELSDGFKTVNSWTRDQFASVQSLRALHPENVSTEER